MANEGDALVAGGVSYTAAYKAGLGKHAVQDEYMKQVQVLLQNDVDFLVGEVRLEMFLLFLLYCLKFGTQLFKAPLN